MQTLEGIDMGLDIYNEYCFFFHIIDRFFPVLYV